MDRSYREDSQRRNLVVCSVLGMEDTAMFGQSVDE